MSEPSLPPPPAVPPSGAPQGLPWERRAELGAVNGFVETVKRLAAEPAAGFREARRQGDLVSPIAYAVLVGWIGFALERIWSFLIGTSLLDMMPGRMHDAGALGFALSGLGLVVGLVLIPIFLLIGLLIYGAILHLFLLLYGGARNSDTGFEGTLRALAWSFTAQLGQVVPFAGGLIALVWGVILQTLALASFHRTTTGRALAAVLTPLLLCCVCVAFFFASLMALFVGGLAAGQH